jgi:hypothetical protein
MPFMLRINGRDCGTFPTEDEAVARAREVVRDTPDAEPEIIDTETGRAAAPAASESRRDDLANKVGY